jgi:hypothetical protein
MNDLKSDVAISSVNEDYLKYQKKDLYKENGDIRCSE